MIPYISDILSSIDIVTPKYKLLVYTAIGVTYLAGVALRSSWESIKITIGHFYNGLSLANRPIQSLNPNLNAIIWGMIATWPDYVTLKIKAKQIAPYLAAALTLTIAHIESRQAQKIMQKNPYIKYKNVPLDLQAGWEACNIRNLTGYKALALCSTVIAVGILTVRILKHRNMESD